MSWIATAAIVSFAGAGLSAYGMYSQGQSTKKMQNANAQIAQQEAWAMEASAKRESQIIAQNQILNEARQRKQLELSKGEMTASYAKRGVAFTGSPLNALAESITNAEMEIAIGAWNSKVEADTALYNAKIGSKSKMSEASLMRQYGQSAATNAMLQAGGTLLQSAGSTTMALSKERTKTKSTIGEGS